jgi:hypothetical protein
LVVLIKAMIALAAVAAVAIGLMLPAPMVHTATSHFLQPGVYSE